MDLAMYTTSVLFPNNLKKQFKIRKSGYRALQYLTYYFFYK